VNGLEPKYQGRIVFFDANTDTPDGEAIARELGVEAIPALFYYDGKGKLVDKSVGGMTAEALDAKLQQLLK